MWEAGPSAQGLAASTKTCPRASEEAVLRSTSALAGTGSRSKRPDQPVLLYRLPDIIVSCSAAYMGGCPWLATSKVSLGSKALAVCRIGSLHVMRPEGSRPPTLSRKTAELCHNVLMLWTQVQSASTRSLQLQRCLTASTGALLPSHHGH